MRVKLTGVALVTYTRTVAIPEEQLEDFLDEGVESFLDPSDRDTRSEIGSWEHIETEVLE